MVRCAAQRHRTLGAGLIAEQAGGPRVRRAKRVCRSRGTHGRCLESFFTGLDQDTKRKAACQTSRVVTTYKCWTTCSCARGIALCLCVRDDGSATARAGHVATCRDDHALRGGLRVAVLDTVEVEHRQRVGRDQAVEGCKQQHRHDRARTASASIHRITCVCIRVASSAHARQPATRKGGGKGTKPLPSILVGGDAGTRSTSWHGRRRTPI